jgi:hypothetical protein
VWIDGERVKDVTAHPGFRNAARMIARMYDSLHDPAKKAVLTTPTDTGNGGFTHRYYKVSRTVEELVAGPLETLLAPAVGTIVVTTRRLITFRTCTGRAAVPLDTGAALS